jgi:hypothetical protein
MSVSTWYFIGAFVAGVAAVAALLAGWWLSGVLSAVVAIGFVAAARWYRTGGA